MTSILCPPFTKINLAILTLKKDSTIGDPNTSITFTAEQFHKNKPCHSHLSCISSTLEILKMCHSPNGHQIQLIFHIFDLLHDTH